MEVKRVLLEATKENGINILKPAKYELVSLLSKTDKIASSSLLLRQNGSKEMLLETTKNLTST